MRAGGPLLFGHRGASARETENTMEAFRAALAGGADGVELDVRLSGDRRAVVFHDEDLERLGGRLDRIDELTARELARLELAGARRIPLLEEVFEELGDRTVLNVELKSPGAGRAGPLVAEVARVAARRPPARLIVSSFDPLALAQLRLRAPRIRRGLLFHGRLSRPLREAWSAPLLGLAAVHPERRLATRPRIERWHRGGWDVNVWTVDHPEEVRRLARCGADALITNDPGAARSALGAPRGKKKEGGA